MQLDYAVKAGMTTNALEWTEEEKQAARDLVGTVGTGDIATSSTVGLVRCGEGLYMASSSGKINIKEPSDTAIVGKTSTSSAITASKIDLAVKVGVTTNALTLTDEEKTVACSWLGVDALIDEKLSAIPFAEEAEF